MSEAYRIGIIVFDGVLTSEVTGPAEVFATASKEDWFKGSTVKLIGVEDQPAVRTEEGLRLGVDATIIDDLELDVLLVPGGQDVSALLEHAGLKAFIRRHEESTQWIGSVCAGAFILGSAGALDGRQATTWFGGEADLQAQFPAIQVVYDQPVVVDRRRITANGGLVSYRAALVLLAKLAGPEHAREIYESLGIGRLGTWTDIASEIVN